MNCRFNGRFLLIFAFLLVLTGGCSVHTRQIRDEALAPVPVPASYTEAPEQIRPAPAPDRWWEYFKDQRLNDLVAEAFTGNLDLEQAYARLEQSEAVTRSAAAGLQPALNLEGSGGRGRQAGVTADSYRLSAAAGYELDLWQKIKSRRDGAAFDAQAAHQDIKTVYLSLSAQIAELYYLAVEFRAQLALTDQTIASYEDILARVELRYREGVVPALDVYQARQNLAAARANRPQLTAGLAAAAHGLAVLAGRYPDRQTAGDLSKLPQPHTELPVGVPSQLLQRRPDIQAAFLRLKASDERIAAAIADRFPALNLTGSYGGAGTALSSLLDSGNIFWNLLTSVAQPVLDGGRRQAEVARNRGVFREDLARYHQTVLQAFQEVEDALSSGSASTERIRLLEERVTAAEAALRLATDRYLQGLSDYLPVLTAQGFAFQARGDLLAARRQLISDRIQLFRALGGSWMEPLIRERLAGPPGRPVLSDSPQVRRPVEDS